MKLSKLQALMLPLVLVMVLAVACGDDEPAPAAPAGITAADLQSAIAGIEIPEGLSADEVEKIVAAQPGITTAELQKAVDAAVVLAVAAAVPAGPAPAGAAQHGTLNIGFQELFTFGTSYQLRSAPEMGFVGNTSNEGFLKLNQDGEVVPVLITEWSLDDSFTEWTFKLRQDAEFHRGWGNVTSDDAIFTFQELISEDSINTWAGVAREYFAAEGGGISKVDDYTFTVDLVTPKRGLIDTLLQPAINLISKDVFESLGQEAASAAGIGTGPWQFEEQSSREFWKFSALEEHYRKAPEFAELVLWDIPENSTRLANFLTGRLDTFLMDFDSKPALDKVPGIRYMAISNGTTAHLGLHPNHYVGMGEADFAETHPGAFGCLQEDSCPWVSPNPDINSPEWERARKVREAMLISVDRQAVVDTILDGEGLAQSLWLWENGLDQLSPQYKEWEFNPDRAGQLLKDAGYENGFDMTVTASTRGVAGEHASCEAVAEYFEDIGIRTTIDRVPQSVIGPKLNARSYVGLNCHGTAGRANPGTIMWNIYSSDSGFSAGTDHPILDDLLDEMLATTDDDSYWAKLNEIAGFVYENAMDSGFYSVNLLFPLGPEVEAWTEHINFGEARGLGAYEFVKHR